MTELHREPVTVSLENEVDEYKRMELALLVMRPRETVKRAIIDAYNDPKWDWEQSDGCTMVSEMYSPPGTKFWPCVMHDHECWKSRQAKTLKEACEIRRNGDQLFFDGMLDYGVNPLRAKCRWMGVRTAWKTWYILWWPHIAPPWSREKEGCD